MLNATAVSLSVPIIEIPTATKLLEPHVTWSKHAKPQPCTLPGNLIPNPLEDLYGEYSAKKD